MTLTCGLSLAGTVASANALGLFGCAGNCSQFMQLHFTRTSLFIPDRLLAHFDEVDNLGHLALCLSVVGLRGAVADLLQTQCMGGCNLVLLAADQALDQLYIDLFHTANLPYRMSFTDLPRTAATSSAVRS